jgi:TonB family protein
MSFFLDTQETSQRFGDQISEFRSLLDINHIRHDSPDNIFEFAKMLENNNQLRLDLSAMVKSIVKREGDKLLLTDMVSIIATAVGGPSFADTHADITKPTNTLMEFLLGTGCWRQFGSPTSPTSKDAEPPLKSSIRAEEPRPGGVSRSASIPIVSESTEDRAGLLDASRELRQMLTRLESNTQQVERHLDSIEQRLSRIEPSPKPLPTPVTSRPEPILHLRSSDIDSDRIAQSHAEGTPVFEPELPTRNRAVFSHQPHPIEEHSQADDFPSPTFAYATEKRRSIIPVGVFLVLLAIVAGVLFFVHSGQGRRLLEAGVSRLKDVRALFSSGASATTAPPKPIASSPPTPSPPTAAPAAPSATIPEPAKSTTEPTPAQPAATANANPNASSNTQPIADNPKIRRVPANLMEGYLLSAPRPRYPSVARNNHIEGIVALEVTVSKTGSIETLHVIKGPPALRSAAVDAVRYWRYRPYSVDGRPVEVATTVNVHFTLKPPPALVR